MSALIFLGAFYGGTAVMLGAFGAHGLKKTINDPQRLQNWNTAAQVSSEYHIGFSLFMFLLLIDIPCINIHTWHGIGSL